MGVDYAAKIMVGLPYDEAVELLDEEQTDDFQERLYGGDIDRCPLYFDASLDDSVVGFQYARTPHYDCREVDWDQAVIDQMKEKFFEMTGKEAKVFLCTYGS